MNKDKDRFSKNVATVKIVCTKPNGKVYKSEILDEKIVQKVFELVPNIKFKVSVR